MIKTKTRPQIICEFYVLAGDRNGVRYGELAEIWFDQAAAEWGLHAEEELTPMNSFRIQTAMVELVRCHERHLADLQSTPRPASQGLARRLWDFLSAPTLSSGPH